MGSYIPNPGRHDPIAAAEAKAGSMKLNILTLENWKDTLYGPVSEGQTTPEDWWVLTTGGNKTCFGEFGNGSRADLSFRLIPMQQATAAMSSRPSTRRPPSTAIL